MAIAGAHRIAGDRDPDGATRALPLEGLLVLAHTLFLSLGLVTPSPTHERGDSRASAATARKT
jgi:hypothetical protein